MSKPKSNTSRLSQRIALKKWKSPRAYIQHDLDFSDCPQEELHTCFRYEYARESKMKEVVGWLREHQEKFQMAFKQAKNMVDCIASHPQYKLNAKEKSRFEQATSLLGMSCLLFDWFAFIPDFPNRPWLDLPSKVRIEYIKIPKDAKRDSNVFLGLRIQTCETSGRNMWPLWLDCRQSLQHPEAIQGWHKIPTGFSKRDILRQFENYLENISKMHPKFFSKKSGGRGGALDKLNQLGAYRILCGRSPKMAARLVAQNKINIGKNNYLANEEDDYSSYRARNAAEQQIEIFNDYADDLLKIFPPHLG